MPASSSTSASLQAVSGVAEAGLRITALPAAKAGAILCATVLSGELNGVIASTTPSGTRSVKPMRPRLLRRAGERNHLAGEPPRLLGRELQRLDAAAHFARRVRGGEAGLHLHGAHEIVQRAAPAAPAARSRIAPRSKGPGAPRRNAACARADRLRDLLAVRRRHVGAGLRGGTCPSRRRRRALAGDPLSVREQRLHGILVPVGHSHRIFLR